MSIRITSSRCEENIVDCSRGATHSAHALGKALTELSGIIQGKFSFQSLPDGSCPSLDCGATVTIPSTALAT